MKVGVIGLGYVGLVTAACLAEKGIDVVATDKDSRRLSSLSQGKIPFYEPGLDHLVIECLEVRRLSFLDSTPHVVDQSDIIFLAVGTPQSKDGSEVDLSQVNEAILEIRDALAARPKAYTTIAVKSTVPPGTTTSLGLRISNYIPRGNFSVVSNPEFLREGSALEDFRKPDRVIVGAEDKRAIELLRQLYAPFMRTRDRFLVMSPEDAELSKYAANAFLATKITFMNDLASLTAGAGCDIENIRRALGSDPRIGSAHLFPGSGYGGSCFPKDLRALLAYAREQGYPLPVVEAVDESNDKHKFWLAERVTDHLGQDLREKVIALWGLAFKPRTDDIRESPSIYTVENLLEFGAKIRTYDPEPRARENFRARFEDRLTYYSSRDDTLDGADALLIATDADQFRGVDPEIFRLRLKNPPLVIDAKNLYGLDLMREHEIKYVSRGRPTARPE